MPAYNNHADDALLLLQLKNGSIQAFDMLYKRYWDFVFNKSYKRLKDVSLAEDITQEVFTQLWLLGSRNEIKSLPNYLFISLKNRIIRVLEKESRYIPVSEILDHLKGSAESADAALLYRELVSAYKALVNTFPSQQRLIFQLRYMENLSPSQIADKLGLSPKTVRNHLGKINHKLRSNILLIHLIFFYIYNR